MPIHDLHCTLCGCVRLNVMVSNEEYGRCIHCRGKMTWTPFVVATDVYGCETISSVLDETRSDDGENRPLTYTSTREREKKMKAMGFEPAGDKVKGARNNDGFKGTIFSRP